MPSKKTQSETESQNRIVAEARREREQWEKTYRAQALKFIPGSVHGADANLVEKSFANSRSITRTTITTTILPTEVTGNCCASTVMKMNTRGMRIPQPTVR
jgi:hypothetical protein